MNKLIILIIISIFSFSCSSNVKGTWSCPILEGGKGSCVSIQEADILSHSSLTTLQPTAYSDSNQKIKIKLLAPKLKQLRQFKNIKKKEKIVVENENQKYRTKEKVGRIWFAPYIDSEGNQHSEGYIYVVDEKPRWVIQK